MNWREIGVLNGNAQNSPNAICSRRRRRWGLRRDCRAWRGPKAWRTSPAGPFAPSWDSLIAGYQAPQWYRDAKFGIWAHWGPQCAPEDGDWYARNMYLQGQEQYDHHLKHYGHPADTGFIDVIRTWTAENFDPTRCSTSM